MVRLKGLSSGLLTFVSYILLPWLGWWVGASALWPITQADFLPSFLAEPARSGYLVVICGTILATILLDSRLPEPPTRPHPMRPGSVYWRHISLETILVLSAFSDHREIFVLGSSSLLRWAGLLLLTMGAGLALWANFLHSQAAARQDSTAYEPVLLVEGPFRRLRYPGYLGLLVLSLGIALVFRSVIGVATCIFMLNFIVMRINEEDQLARSKFGIQWTAYSRKSWRLVPYLY